MLGNDIRTCLRGNSGIRGTKQARLPGQIRWEQNTTERPCLHVHFQKVYLHYLHGRRINGSGWWCIDCHMFWEKEKALPSANKSCQIAPSLTMLTFSFEHACCPRTHQTGSPSCTASVTWTSFLPSSEPLCIHVRVYTHKHTHTRAYIGSNPRLPPFGFVPLPPPLWSD